MRGSGGPEWRFGFLCHRSGAGFAGSVGAESDESQRLRGMAERVFRATVEVTRDDLGIFELSFGAPDGTTFTNCYIFAADANDLGNNWFETAFPTEGNWHQGSVGAKTSQLVTNPGGFEQLGQVTPAGGKGILQLEALSSLGFLGLEFASVGFEVHGSDINDCPVVPIFTPPSNPQPKTHSKRGSEQRPHRLQLVSRTPAFGQLQASRRFGPERLPWVVPARSGRTQLTARPDW